MVLKRDFAKEDGKIIISTNQKIIEITNWLIKNDLYQFVDRFAKFKRGK